MHPKIAEKGGEDDIPGDHGGEIAVSGGVERWVLTLFICGIEPVLPLLF